MALSESEKIEFEEVVSRFLSADSPEAFRAATDYLRSLVPFRHFATALIPIEPSGLNMDLEWAFSSYPPDFVQAYLENHHHLMDLAVLENFRPEQFGQVRRWSDIYQLVEDEPDRYPAETMRMHYQFLEFVAQWGILADGYTMGYKGFHAGVGKELGSIFSIADDLEFSERNQALLDQLRPHIHQGLVHVFLR
ncbi:MAG: autoinducer binding domain-containing protein [bacterium]|nr:autoinducer binding domain-containing protein [bacterium]